MGKFLLISSSTILLAACSLNWDGPEPFEPSPGHLHPDKEVAPAEEIPEVVQVAPFVPAPEPVPELERYTVVVNQVPVGELLFALARDANLNVDIDPSIEGVVTLNAVDQTLPQILDRLARQVDLRYETKANTLILSPDRPYLRTYPVDYVNITRDMTSTNQVSTQVATTGGGAELGEAGGGGAGTAGGTNASVTQVETLSFNRFWETLTVNILAIIGEEAGATRGAGIPYSEFVIVNPESGLISVLATAREHEQVQAFIDQVMANAERQVMVEATVAEVTLSDQFQAGIDWSVIDIGAEGIDITQLLLPAIPIGTTTFFTIERTLQGGPNDVSGLLSLLDEFGDTTVLSSPRLMVLNNQTALLKVVENVVYFTVEQDTVTPVQGGATQASTSTVHTVPVGFVMTVTPQISKNDAVTLIVRPTISRITSFVDDPNPALVVGGTRIENQVPQIAVREMESVLKVNSGDIAVLGGLMTDITDDLTTSVPFLSKLPLVGELFFTSVTKDYRKTELVIFLRPVVVHNASLAGDLADYRPFLEEVTAPAEGYSGREAGP
ncbi:MAG: secretin N-terminal domain-containing protein [Gammaproteobacteria bacterium]